MAEPDGESEIRAQIRKAIRPFPHTATYATGWDGHLSFEAIRDAITPNLNRLMRYYRRIDADIPDMMAHGFMRLWEALSENPDLLAETDHGGAVKWVLNRSGASQYRKWYRREMYMEDYATRDNDPDEFDINGYGKGFHEGNAIFTRVVDLRVDIERAVQTLAAKYHDNMPYLAALYYITTDVACEDAASLAGRGGSKRSWWLTSVVKPVRQELWALMDRSPPKKSRWQDQFNAGEDAPFQQLMATYEARGETRMCTTLANLQSGGTQRALQEILDVPMTTVGYLRRVAHRDLNEAYGCGV